MAYPQTKFVSMPHAAIFRCNPVQIRAKSPVPKFQCRTRQFSGAIMYNIAESYINHEFQCRTRQFSGAIARKKR